MHKILAVIFIVLFVIAIGIVVYNRAIGDPNLVLDQFAKDCRDVAEAMGKDYMVSGTRERTCLISDGEGNYAPLDSYVYVEE